MNTDRAAQRQIPAIWLDIITIMLMGQAPIAERKNRTKSRMLEMEAGNSPKIINARAK